MKPFPSGRRRARASLLSWESAADPAAGRRRIEVPSAAGFTSGHGCDVVETSAEHGSRILGILPSPGYVLADGDRWSWIVPTGSNIDVAWPPIAAYFIDAAVLVPHYGPRPTDSGGHRVIHWPEQESAVPYTHPILLYFAVCCIAGIQPVLAVH